MEEPLLSGSPHPLVQMSPSRRLFLEQVAIFNFFYSFRHLFKDGRRLISILEASEVCRFLGVTAARAQLWRPQPTRSWCRWRLEAARGSALE